MDNGEEKMEEGAGEGGHNAARLTVHDAISVAKFHRSRQAAILARSPIISTPPDPDMTPPGRFE
jgi:hypothetical protein